MSREQKIHAEQTPRVPLSPIKPPGEVTPQEKADIASLLANGDSGLALEQAKRIHKRCRTAASEALLLEAYLARIPALANRGLENETNALIQLVSERYPAARERLRTVTALFASAGDGIHDLLRPLNDEMLAPERRMAILKSIRCRVSDLSAISECSALPDGHPLRIAAAALVRALEAVTTSPMADAELALPEISRQSPLAPWKMLVRAVAAFYRREDSLCEKYLAAIEPDSVAARLVPGLQTLLGQHQTLSPAALTLVNQVGGTLEELRSGLEKLDKLLNRRDQSESCRQIRSVVAECQTSCPDLLERLKQHISIRCMRAGLKRERVSQALGGWGSLKNAYFWKLLARAYEQSKQTPDSTLLTCYVWEEFRRHAVHEGWFPEKGPEAATLYLHIADLILHLHPDDARNARWMFAARFPGLASYYEGQPAEIRALMLPNKVDLSVIDPDNVFARACEADPCSENFQRWLDWTKQQAPRLSDTVAERWSARIPEDVKPLLHLMSSAEKRGAFQTAFDYMQRAEMIDGVSPEVRKARFRLLLSMATRHLQKKKTKLAWPELNQLAALPQTQQGDRRAYVAALNWVGCMILGREEEAEKERSDVFAVLNNEIATRLVLRGAASACKFQGQLPDLSQDSKEPVTAAVGRACALGEDVGVPIGIPAKLSAAILRELTANHGTIELQALYALGEAALHQETHKLAYAASAAGLAGSPAGHARFLFLRARALPYWEDLRQDACLGAASELARRQRDHGLLDKIGNWRDEELGPLGPVASDVSMSTEEVDRILQQEKAKAAFPASNPNTDGATHVDEDRSCNCPACLKFAEEAPEEFVEFVNTYGPETVTQALAELVDEEIKHRKKKQQKRDVGF